MRYPKHLGSKFEQLAVVLDTLSTKIDANSHRIKPEDRTTVRNAVVKGEKLMRDLLKNNLLNSYDEDCHRYLTTAKLIIMDSKGDLTLPFNQD